MVGPGTDHWPYWLKPLPGMDRQINPCLSPNIEPRKVLVFILRENHFSVRPREEVENTDQIPVMVVKVLRWPWDNRQRVNRCGIPIGDGRISVYNEYLAEPPLNEFGHFMIFRRLFGFVKELWVYDTELYYHPRRYLLSSDFEPFWRRVLRIKRYQRRWAWSLPKQPPVADEADSL